MVRCKKGRLYPNNKPIVPFARVMPRHVELCFSDNNRFTVSTNLARIILTVLLLCAPLASGFAAPTIPVSDFSALDNVVNPVLSPDGKHLAVTMDIRDTLFTYRMLTIYAVPEMKAVNAIKLSDFRRPKHYLWVSNTRLALSLAYPYAGGVDGATGEVEALDINGERQLYLFGRRRPGGRDGCWPSRIQTLSQPDENLFVTVSEEDCNSMFIRINSVDGKRTFLADLKERGMHFLADAEGNPRIAMRDAAGRMDVRRYDKEAKKWVPGPGDGQVETSVPIAVTPDGSSVYIYDRNESLNRLILQPIEGGAPQVLASFADREMDRFQWTHEGKRPYAIISHLDVPTIHYLDDSADEARIQKMLAGQFPGQFVRLLDGSSASGRWLFRVTSDRDPGSLYLFDSKENKASLIVTEMDKIDPDQMAPKRVIKFKARDGLEIHGYLTLPINQPAGYKPPLIVKPHGGPHGIADTWEFDRDVQFLASRGYAVLQVNYRGSGGRGIKFMEAGFQHWADTIQDDILDGVDWVVAQGLVDASRMCTMGGSFGAYSAMMLNVRAPGKFRCAVGSAGLYDIPLHLSQKNQYKALKERFEQYLGTDAEKWGSISPVNNARQLRIPVMLVHGKDDENTTLEQARKMRAALKAAGNPPLYFEASEEGHGFSQPDNISEFYEKLEKFLAEHLK